MQAESLLREGKVDEALKDLEAAVRKNPADAKLRVFLFQLLCVMGQWERAMTQLNVAAEMNPANLLMAQVCRPALNCEALRAHVFGGARVPLVMGEPEEWVGWMIQANQMTATGRHAEGAALRENALEAAPAVAGFLDGKPFEWLADADARLGPMLEVIAEGKYYWVPFNRVLRLDIEAPTDLRDVVWTPGRLTLINGGSFIVLLPARYPGSESSPDGLIRLARKTEWAEREGGLFAGLGQRLFATDGGEQGILETRSIVFGDDPKAGAPDPERADG